MGIFSKAQPVTLSSGDTGPLVPVLPGVDLAGFYSQNTGCSPDPGYFGIYAVQGVASQLYLGFGTARPAEANGALLAYTDGKTLTPVKSLPEQGFIGMKYGGSSLYVPGADPTEDWTLGDLYCGRPPNNVELHRNLPNVVHTWGVHPDTGGGRVYAAVGRHAGDNQTFYGGVFVSDDQGDSWAEVEDPHRVLGKYRTYDVAGTNGWLYATANDVYERPSELVASSDGGATWKRIANNVMGRPRLLVTRDGVAALRSDGNGLVIARGSRVTRTRFRTFTASEWAYNVMCAGYGGRYYILAGGGQIYGSPDLVDWELIADTGLNLLSIGYWQNKNWLIVTDRGSDAGLYRLDLALYGAV